MKTRGGKSEPPLESERPTTASRRDSDRAQERGRALAVAAAALEERCVGQGRREPRGDRGRALPLGNATRLFPNTARPCLHWQPETESGVRLG